MSYNAPGTDEKEVSQMTIEASENRQDPGVSFKDKSDVVIDRVTAGIGARLGLDEDGVDEVRRVAIAAYDIAFKEGIAAAIDIHDGQEATDAP